MEINMLVVRMVVGAGVLSMLGGCARDNPNNVPELGRWLIETKIRSVSVDGILAPPENYPASFKGINDSREICTEPVLRINDSADPKMMSSFEGSADFKILTDNCVFEKGDSTKTKFSIQAKCAHKNNDLDLRSTLTIEGRESSDFARAKFVLEGVATFADDREWHKIRINAVQEFKRLGDC